MSFSELLLLVFSPQFITQACLKLIILLSQPLDCLVELQVQAQQSHSCIKKICRASIQKEINDSCHPLLTLYYVLLIYSVPYQWQQ